MLKIRNDLDQWKHRGRRNQEGFIEEMMPNRDFIVEKEFLGFQTE